MCGINGIINYQGSDVSKKVLEKMNSILKHRGPDDDGFYLNNNIGFSMQRLSIIGLKTGKQPISNRDGTLWIVFNGEIYNYKELREELVKKGYNFKTNTDTEVIIHLFEEERENCLKKLNGIFSFAIWDNIQKKMFLARDRLGVKPLFYSNNSNSFYFSSELKALIEVLPNGKNIDRQSILLYMFLMYVPTPRSIIKDIYKLEPGHFLWVDPKGKVKKTKYWEIKSKNKKNNISIDEALEKLDWLINDSIRLQLRSDVPIGTFLSGGLDSSGVVHFLSKNIDERMRTYSISYEGHIFNELPLAKLVSHKYNTIHKEMIISPDDVYNNLPKMARYLDEPIYDSAIIPTYMLSKLAKKDGVKVLLNGTGGDEIFGGYDRYCPSGLHRRAFNKTPFLFRRIIGHLLKYKDNHLSLRFNNKLFDYLCSISGELSFLDKVMKDKNWINELISEVEISFRHSFDKYSNYSNMQRLMCFDTKTYLLDDLLFLLDKMTMAASIEGRVPLLDHRIIEFMVSLPDNYKMTLENNKILYRKLLDKHLPKEILNSPKRGFGGPLQYWAQSDIIKKYIRNTVNNSIFFKEYFNIDALKLLVNDDNFLVANNHSIFSLLVLEEWHNSVIKH